MDDYYFIYTGLQGEGDYWHELDTATYNFTEDDLVIFPDYRDEETLDYNVMRLEGFDESEVDINKFPGYYNDTLSSQCVVLVRVKDLYPSGPMWGLPYSMLLFYSYSENNWKLDYACDFYYDAEQIQLDPKSKLNLLYVRIDYGAMGSYQWIEAVYDFSNSKPNELLYDLTMSSSMRTEAQYLEDPKSFRNYAGGDTLSQVRLRENITDLNNDGVKEFIRTESLTISGKPKKKQFPMQEYTRELIYVYKDHELILQTPGAFVKNEE